MAQQPPLPNTTEAKFVDPQLLGFPKAHSASSQELVRMARAINGTKPVTKADINKQIAELNKLKAQIGE